MANQFKAGDTVRRTGGMWRGVSEGDIKTVDEVHGGNITLVGHPGITFDGDNFELVESADGGARKFEVGDRVRMISESPAHGAGEVSVGDIGVIARICSDSYTDCKIDFPAQRGWNANFTDIEHEIHVPAAVVVPEVSLDEAVANWQDAAQQIKELQAQVVQYERIMRRHGVRPV